MNGPTADTVLGPDVVLPDDSLTGQVHLEGGSADVHIERIPLSR
ncbi:sporulation protein [Streptomyces chilikensis]